jgi:hypothetical protein
LTDTPSRVHDASVLTAIVDHSGVLAVTDPNWFFSTLSQSAAAIVGIVGGFFVARLLQQIPAVNESRQSVISNFLVARSGPSEAAANVRAYCEWGDPIREQVETGLRMNGAISLEMRSYRELNGNAGSSSAPIARAFDANWPTELDEAHAFEPKITAIGDKILRLVDVAQLRPLTSDFIDVLGHAPEQLQPQLEEQSRQLMLVAREAEVHQGRAVPPQATPLLILLGLIAVVGIFLPLGFLSAGDGMRVTAKALLLTGFGVLLAALGYFLSRLIGEIRGAASLEIPERSRVR